MKTALKLGCIADDFTGATDLANTLVRQGMRVVQANGVPTQSLDDEVDAVVVALKTRTAAPADAVSQSLAALQWLRMHGAEQIYFKVCSTFDSTPRGNIGPVSEALMAALDAEFALVTPAFPENGRTVFKGHLFVGDVLLSESGMRTHPLTPMTDPNLVRVLQAQCRGPVGLVERRTVAAGPEAIRTRIAALRAQGIGMVIADAIDNDDLMHLGAAAHGAALLVGASGLAIGLPRNWGLAPAAKPPRLPAVKGSQAIVSGSCSEATQRQVGRFIEAGGQAWMLDPLRVGTEGDAVHEALDWAGPRLGHGPVLLYSSASADAVQRVQSQLGMADSGALVEQTLAAIARGLVERGVRRLVVAGGETSGACVQALGIDQMRIGPQIDPGVPWCHARCNAAPKGLLIALKSGNFGSDEFFTKALAA